MRTGRAGKPAGAWAPAAAGRSAGPASAARTRSVPRRAGASGHVSGEGDPVQHAAVAVVVVDRVVQHAAVIPQRERTRRPAEAAGVLGAALVVEQVREQRLGLGLGPALEARGVRDVHVERHAAGLGVRARHRVHRLVRPGRLVATVGAQAVLAGLGDVRLGRARDRPQRPQRRTQALRQRVPRRVAARELGVAAVGRQLAREQQRARRRALEVRGVGVPDAAEVAALVLELLDLDDLREARQPLDERVLDRLADRAGERHERGLVEALARKEDHLVLEPGRADRGDGRRVEGSGEVDAAQLGAERAGDAHDLERVCHVPSPLPARSRRAVPRRSVCRTPVAR
jgi:hypothetical protein